MATTTVDIRKNDTVKVITGKDKGKQGRVLRVMPDKGRVLVEHIGVVKKHVRPNPQKRVKGGIAEQESARARTSPFITSPLYVGLQVLRPIYSVETSSYSARVTDFCWKPPTNCI